MAKRCAYRTLAASHRSPMPVFEAEVWTAPTMAANIIKRFRKISNIANVLKARDAVQRVA
jgi:hypothetical protein